MNILSDTLILSRLQFAVTALFHMIWPLLTVGLSILIVVLEALWLKKKDRAFYILTRFWSKLFLLNFALGVISGITMEFEFGTNWVPFYCLSSEFFGNMFGAFPLAYANVLQALYMPVLLMLFALIFRGVSLEFRVYSERQNLWTLAFGMGSLLAAIAQGLALGTLLGGLPLYAEESPVNVFVWATPLSFLAAVVLAALYILLGSCYLLGKVEDEFRDAAYRWARLTARAFPWLFVLQLGFCALKTPHLAEQWRAHPFGFGGLACTLAAFYFMLLRNLNLQRDHQPFYWSLAALAAAFIFLLASYYPYLIPGAMTLHMAASSAKTLEFMLYAVGGLLPLMLAYNAYQYYVFRGRVISEHQ